MNLTAIRVSPRHTNHFSMTGDPPPSLAAYQIPCAESPVVVSGDFGHYYLQQISIPPHFRLWYHNLALERDEIFHFTAPGPVLMVQFNLENSVAFTGEGDFLIYEGRYNLLYLPVVNHLAAFRKHRIYSSVCIYYPLEELEKMSGTFPVVAAFLNNIRQHKFSTLHESSQPISPDIERMLKNLLHCHYNDTLKDSVFQLQVLGIFYAIVDRTRFADQREIRLTIEQVDRLKNIQQAIRADLENGSFAIDVKKLSRIAGMNERKLKDMFKMFFRISITDYHISLRMELAEGLLIRTDHTIDIIADAAGYENGRTFSKEFAKHHEGVSPDKYRKLHRDQAAGEGNKIQDR